MNVAGVRVFYKNEGDEYVEKSLEYATLEGALNEACIILYRHFEGYSRIRLKSIRIVGENGELGYEDIQPHLAAWRRRHLEQLAS